MVILKFILFTITLLNYAYLSLLTLQLLLCEDATSFNRERFFSMSWKRRLRRFRLALKSLKYKTYLLFCISSFIFTFGYLNELAKSQVEERKLIYLIAATIISTAIRMYFYINGNELEVFKQWKENHEVNKSRH